MLKAQVVRTQWLFVFSDQQGWTEEFLRTSVQLIVFSYGVHHQAWAVFQYIIRGIKMCLFTSGNVYS